MITITSVFINKSLMYDVKEDSHTASVAVGLNVELIVGSRFLRLDLGEI